MIEEFQEFSIGVFQIMPGVEIDNFPVILLIEGMKVGFGGRITKINAASEGASGSRHACISLLIGTTPRLEGLGGLALFMDQKSDFEARGKKAKPRGPEAAARPVPPAGESRLRDRLVQAGIELLEFLECRIGNRPTPGSGGFLFGFHRFRGG
jgi:hypothetical protein